MPIPEDLEKQLSEFESLLDRYFRKDPIDEANQLQREAVDAFNTWQEEQVRALEGEREGLEGKGQSMQELQEQIEAFQNRLQEAKSQGAGVEDYNRLVGEYNCLVNDSKTKVSQYQTDQEAYNQKVERYNQSRAQRQKETDILQRQAKEKGETYHRWVTGKGDERFARDVNQCYASLHRGIRDGVFRYEEVDECIKRLRKIRLELGRYATAQQEKAENGLLLVQATLCGTELCWMIVDTGATLVSITPELVDVLDLHEFVGDQIEIALPAGIRVQASQLVLPAISVDGMKAEYIKAVVLPGSHPGWDGSLGLSFLNRFLFQIKKGRPQTLSLAALAKPTQGNFDVFICHKSADFAFAKQVYDHLTASGYSPFLSEVSLQQQGDAQFSRSIETALEGAKHIVIVGSSPAHIKSPWVEQEWRMFINLQLSRGGRGNVIPVLCGDMVLKDLPAALSLYQSISLADPNWKTALVNYLPRN